MRRGRTYAARTPLPCGGRGQGEGVSGRSLNRVVPAQREQRHRVAPAPRSDHATPPPAAPVDGRAGGPKPLRYNPRLRNGRRASRPGTRDAGCRMTAVPKCESGSVATRTSAVCAARVIRVRPETPSPCPLPQRRERGIRSLKGERGSRMHSKSLFPLGCGTGFQPVKPRAGSPCHTAYRHRL